MSRRSPFPAKLAHQLADHLRAEGHKVIPKDKGYWIGFKNGYTTTFHLTVSDTRAYMNIRSSVKKGGASWPFDKK